jgi:hypothetical protein
MRGETVKSFWYGRALSPYEVLSLCSFRDHGHQVELYTYDTLLHVPSGVRLCDASEILPKSRVFFYASGPGAGSVAGFANLFRYMLLRQKGGWWVDTDVICLSSQLPDEPRFLAWEESEKLAIGNAILKFATDDPILLKCLEDMSTFRPDVPWGTTGPILLTAIVKTLGFADEIQPFSTAYPWHHTRTLDVLDPSHTDAIKAATEGATFQHLWHENLRRSGVTKLIRPPPESCLDLYFKRHKVSFPDHPAYDKDDVERAVNALVAAAASEQARAEKLLLQTRLATMSAEAQAYRKDIGTLQSKHAHLVRENNNLRHENRGLRQRLERSLTYRINRFLTQGGW